MAQETEEDIEIIRESSGGSTRFTPTVALCTLLLLGASTLSVMSFKTQSKLGFKHGLFQTFMMFVGEYGNLLIFGFVMSNDGRRFNHFLALTNEAKDKGLNLHSTKLWMATTSLLDTLGSTFHLTALLLLPPSL